MSRREDVGRRLRSSVPGAVRAPDDVRDAVDRAVVSAGPGDERATPGARPTRAISALAALALVGAIAVLVTLHPAAPITPAPDPLAHAPATPPPAADPLIPRVVPVANPLVDEAHRMWTDLQRLRSTVEGPVRSLAEAGKSL